MKIECRHCKKITDYSKLPRLVIVHTEGLPAVLCNHCRQPTITLIKLYRMWKAGTIEDEVIGLFFSDEKNISLLC